MPEDTLTKAAGVDELIDRLKSDGVAKGQQQAEAIVADAKRQALSVLDTARQEADQIVAKAKQEAERAEQTGRQALQLASRDVLLKLRESFQLQFRNRLAKLVQQQLDDRQLLGKLILEVAGKARPDEAAGRAELLLPAEAADNDPLHSYVAGLTAEMLREGVDFGVGDDIDAGLRVRLTDQDVEIELTDEALAAFLERFLVPRFRQIMDFKS